MTYVTVLAMSISVSIATLPFHPGISLVNFWVMQLSKFAAEKPTKYSHSKSETRDKLVVANWLAKLH
jgi:hypothetical protein